MWSILNREYRAIDHIIDVTSGTRTSSEQGRTPASRKQAGTYALSKQAKKRFLARTGLPRVNRAELLRNPMKSMINPQIGSVYEKKLLSSLTWLGERGEFPDFFSTSEAATETRAQELQKQLEDPSRSFSELVRPMEDSNWLAGVSWLLSNSFGVLRLTRPRDLGVYAIAFMDYMSVT